jgi:UDP-N-acetylmuramyl tripeptide synthase
MEMGSMEEVRRPLDGELCGHVEPRDGIWFALVVFGGVLGHHPSREDAVEQVLAQGLAVLADRWLLRDPTTGSEEVVCIQEANVATVTLALDYYSLPGVPTRTITTDQLARGVWELRR